MLLNQTEENKARLDAIRAFVEAEIYPLEGAVAARGFADCVADLDAVRAKVKARGWWGPQIPVEDGGMGLSFLEHAQLSEVLGASPLGHYAFNCQAPDAGNMEILHKFGSDAQKERWLKPLFDGEIRSCFSMTEPDRAGSNPTWMDTTAVEDGDEWVVNGRKWFTTSADGAAFAIVMCVTAPDATPFQRASMIIVPTKTPGFKHVRRISVMGHEGSGWSSHSEIDYVDCRVPKANLLGGVGAGFLMAQERLGPGRIHHCMRWLGIAERAFDLMCKRAVSRMVAPGRPLGSRQIIQQWVAECRAEIDAARLYIHHAARKIDEEGTYAARSEISCVKFFAADMLTKVLDRSLQTHGALGMTDDLPLAWFYAHERAAHIYDGPDEVHKQVVARRILKKYGLEIGSQAR